MGVPNREMGRREAKSAARKVVLFVALSQALGTGTQEKDGRKMGVSGLNKYRNHRTRNWDSNIEKQRYAELLLLQRAGKITNLRRQVPIELLPSQYEDGKCVERGVKYICDFVYVEDGQTIWEDVKSPITRKNKDYIIKRKLLLYFHHIRLREYMGNGR